MDARRAPVLAKRRWLPRGVDIVIPALNGRASGLIVMRIAARAVPLLLFSAGASVLAAVVVLLRGYQFGVSNHNPQIPLILRFQDAAYLADDWYVNANSAFGPRTYYVALMSGLDRFLELDIAFAAAFGLSAALLVGGLVVLGRQAGGTWTVGALTAVVALLTTRSTLAAYFELQPLLIPSTLSAPLIVWAAVFMLKGRLLASAALLALATYPHPVSGLQSTLVIATLALWQGHSRKELMLAGGAYLLLASPVLLPSAFIWNDSVGPAGDYVRIVANERHPHHYLATTFSTSEYVSFLSFLTVGLAALGFVWLSRFRQYASFALRALLIIAGLCVAGYLAVEVWPVKPIALMQFFRLTVLLKYLLSAVIGVWLVQLMRTRSGLPVALLILAALIGSTFFPMLLRVAAAVAAAWTIWFALSRTRAADDRERLLLIVWLGAVLLAAVPSMLVSGNVLSALDQEKRALLEFVGSGQFWMAGLVFTGLAALALRDVPWRKAALAGCGVVAGVSVLGLGASMATGPHLGGVTAKVAIQQPSSREVDDVAQYARANTPDGSVFLTPPYAADFRLRAERAIVVDFKSFPFLADATFEWRERIGAVTGGYPLPDGLMMGWLSLSTDELQDVGCRYDATHVMVERDRGFRGDPLYSGRSFDVYPLVCSSEGSTGALHRGDS